MMKEKDQERDFIDALDVYSQYFHAMADLNGIKRRAAIVKLTLLKDTEGICCYQISASLMPFEDEEDFRVPEDARFEKIVFDGKKRRMKKKEAELLETIREDIRALLPEDAEIFFDRPLREARFG